MAMDMSARLQMVALCGKPMNRLPTRITGVYTHRCSTTLTHVRAYALSRYREDAGRRQGRGNRRTARASAPVSSKSEPSSLNGSQNGGPERSLWNSYDHYTPVNIDEWHDDNAPPPPVLKADLLSLGDPASQILSQPSLVVVRQLEMMNVFLGYEQANRYRLVNARGQDVGFLAEQEGGFGSAISRQVMRGHRPFSCVVLDINGNVVLRVNRPFSWVNSRISVYKGEEEPGPSNKIGECQQIWHPYRRKYALFERDHEDAQTTSTSTSDGGEKALVVANSLPNEHFVQFAEIDSRILAWDFYLQGEAGQVLASINRNFMGFGRELFTDTGQYVLRFDKEVADQEIQARLQKGVGLNEEIKKVAEENAQAQRKDLVAVEPAAQGLTLNQRAILLASAVTIDIDYFSRTGGGGLHMPMLWMPLPGGSSEAPPPVADAPEAGSGSTADGTSPAPIASPEYGDSPGLEPYPETGSSYPVGEGSYGGESSFGGDDVLQDPWASDQQQSQEGGGFWGWVGDISDSFGGGDE